MSCEKGIRRTEVIRDTAGKQIGISTNDPKVINQIEDRIEGRNLDIKSKVIGTLSIYPSGA